MEERNKYNKEYHKEYNQRPEVKARIKEYKKQYYLDNRERELERCVEYYQNHKEQKKEYGRSYRQKPEVKKRRLESARQRRKENPEKLREYQHKRNQNIRMEVIKYYSNGKMACKCCNEMELKFLTVDHINNNGAEHRRTDKSARTICSWLYTHNFPEGFQILCMNCNFAKGKYGKCPHGGEKK